MNRTHYRRLACSPAALGIITALALTTFGLAGCEAPEDTAANVDPIKVEPAHDGGPSCQPTSPCAAIFCGPDRRCVVVDTQPPTAICEVVTQPPACSSNSDCPDTMICTNVPGVCGHDPSCDANAGGGCLTICRAICAPKPDPQPARCVSNHDCQPSQQCSTARGDCQGCGAPIGTACLAVCYGVCESIPNGV